MSKPTITDRLAAACAELDATNRQIAELAEKRNAALLADDDRTAAKLVNQIDDLRSLLRGHKDKIHLLEQETERERIERQAKEKAALIGRIEKKFSERDAAGAELAEAIKKADAILSGTGPYTEADIEFAKQAKLAMETDADVRAFILAGSAEARRYLIGVSQILRVAAEKS
jgi:hypothetical protein